MFEKFGEFDSYEEINRAAAAQRDEGDEEALIALALENGIDKEDAEAYMDQCIEELCTPVTAALGKLKVEKEELKLKGILLDWAEELEEVCMNDSAFAFAVRKKGKGLDGYIAKLAEEGYRNRAIVDKRIVEKAPNCKKMCGNHEFAIGVPDKTTRKRLALQYYMEEKS